MSGILRKRPPSSSGTPTQPSSSKKQRFIDAAKMLIDIAKESTDAFPPLKSCLGGINALIKHYEQYTDVKDKLDDLIPWLKKLLVTLAKVNPSDDHDEVERRSELGKSLEDIGKRSLALSEKGKGARFLDKTRDSGEVIRLVEDLRRAILIYQVSQQQSIYNQVVHLTSSFDALLKVHQTSPVKNKIESVRARLDRLEAERDGAKSADEFRRRKGLYEVLEGIKVKLELLHERSDTAGDAVKEGDMITVCDLADDLRDAVIEYQLSQQKAIYEQNCKLIDTAELSVLNRCRRAKGAEFRHGDRKGCLRGTRSAVLDEIESWSKDFKMSPVYWLNGLAGTGKSTIAQTISELIFTDGRLGASFFCSRDFEDRRDLRYILPTLAFQLAHKYPEFRSILVPLLQSNPDIAHESLYNQMETLIVGPLSSSDISTVIVIDALDECVDEDPQSAILSVIGRLVEGTPNVKFFITGRPEPRIQSGFRLGLLKPLTDVFVLHEVEPSVVNTDIRLFLEHGLRELAKRQGIEQDGWPTDEQLDLLCERAAGLFIYAMATLKFLDHSFTPPNEQLAMITKAPGNTAYEGQSNLRLGATLDSLYLSSFQSAFSRPNAEDDEKVRLVVGAVVLVINPLSPSTIATLVNLGKQQVMNLLRLIQSLLKFSEDPDSPVLPFHKSFPDFVIDPLRCPDERFHISPGTGHLKLALKCFKMMDDSLEQNLLSLPNYALNSEVEDLEARIDDRISTALKYACKAWYSHLIEVKGDITTIVPILRSFLQERFLAWLEVLSVTGAARDAVIALEKLVPWLQEVARDHQLFHTARDYFQFATNFLEVINVSATHIYHSALELSPPSSVVHKYYYSQRPHPSPRVVTGIKDSWDPSIVVAAKTSYYLSSTWSPCSQLVAVATQEAVEIRDALSLKLLFTLHSNKAAAKFRHGLAFSPDGHSLAGCSETSIVIWDVQTGGVATKIGCEMTSDGLELTWSLDGKLIGAASLWVSETVTVYVYNVESGTMVSSCTLQSRGTPHLWASDTSFQVMTTAQDHKGQTISIFEVGSTLSRIKSFPLQTNSHFKAFSPTTYRALFSITEVHQHDPELLILDIQNSKVLLQATGSYWHPHLSSDASLLAASIGDCLIIWRYTSGHYAKWRQYQQTPMPLCFSPNSSSIIGCDGAFLHILHLEYTPTALATETADATHQILLDTYSPHGAYIATTHHGENVITITNLHSETPHPQLIETNFGISKIVLTGNVLLVKGPDTIVARLLTEEGTVKGVSGNRKAGCNDSLWSTSLQDKNPGFWSSRLQERGRHVSDEYLEFSNADGIGAVRHRNGFYTHIYHTETGQILKLDKKSLHPSRTWYRFYNPHHDDINKYHHDLYKSHLPLEHDWPVSQAILEEGWVKDQEGKHRLWLLPHWRSAGNDVSWLGKVTTLQLKNQSEQVIVKF